MRVAVIGGGVAGLAAAHELLRRGADPVVLEAAGRVGGKVGTRTEQGWVTEDGPNFLAKPLDALLDASGLRAEVVKPRPPTTRWVHLGGRVLEGPSLRLLARAGIFRALLEPLFAHPLREDLSLRDFLQQRLGAKSRRPGGGADERGVLRGRSRAALGARRLSFPRGAGREGLAVRERDARAEGTAAHRAVDAAARPRLAGGRCGGRAGSRVRLGKRVTRLSPAPGGWEVEGESFDAAVLALPAAQAAELLRPSAARFAKAVGRVPRSEIYVVHLGFPGDGLPRGFGMLDADGTLHGIGTLLPSSMLPGRAPSGRTLVTAICGGIGHPERADLPDAALVAGIVEDLRRTWALRSDPEYVRVVRCGAAIPQYALGHREAVRAAREQLSGLPPIAVAGASYDGVGVPDVAHSGVAAATRLLGG